MTIGRRPGHDGTAADAICELDETMRQLWRGDRIVPLRAKTWAVLCYLVENPGVLVTREELCPGECGRYRG